MKTVILFRHGKSDWSAGLPDHERPLAPRGRKAAGRMGRFLSGVEQVPELVVTSTAVRARDTAARAIEAGEWTCLMAESDALYHPSAGSVLSAIRSQAEHIGSVMLVGHEPTWSEVLSLLVGGGVFRFPTAAMARIDLDVGRWDEVEFGQGELRWMVTPKELAGAD